MIAAIGAWWVLRRERREPSAYSRRPDVLASWRAMSTAEQAAYDNAVLDAAELAAARMAEAAQRNALFHP